MSTDFLDDWTSLIKRVPLASFQDVFLSRLHKAMRDMHMTYDLHRHDVFSYETSFSLDLKISIALYARHETRSIVTE